MNPRLSHDSTRSRVLLPALFGLLALWVPPAHAALLNVRDYPSPAAAIAAARDGDRVWFPSPGPYAAPPGGFLISKSLELFGDGMGNGLTGASSVVPDRDGNAFVLDSTVTLHNIHVHDLLVIRTGDAPGSRAALRLALPESGEHKLSGLRIERVAFVNLAGDAIALEGGAQSAILLVSITDCEANSCRGNGITLRHTTTTTVMNGYYHDSDGFGLYAEAAGVRLIGAAFEHNQLAGTNSDYHAQVRLKLCHGFTVLGCHFEEFASESRPARTALTLESCRGGQVASSLFVKNGAGVRGSRGVLILGGSRDVDIGANSWSFVDTLVAIRGANANPGCIVRRQSPLKADARAPGIVQGASP